MIWNSNGVCFWQRYGWNVLSTPNPSFCFFQRNRHKKKHHLICEMLLIALAVLVLGKVPELFDLALGDDVLFDLFTKHYHKHYETAAQEARRFAIFKENLAEYRARNAQRSSPSSATFGVTFFADLLPDELPVTTTSPSPFRTAATSSPTTRTAPKSTSAPKAPTRATAGAATPPRLRTTGSTSTPT